MATMDFGCGVGLRRPHYDDVAGTARKIDWLEITPENWMRRGGRRAMQLAAIAERFVVAPHAVSLSVGGPDPLDEVFLSELDRLCRALDAPFWSDHLAWSRGGGVEVHDLLPLPQTREAIAHVVSRIDEAKRRVSRPFLIENPSTYFVPPGAEMDEATFLAEVLQQADCGLLLDVNNIVVNAHNHGLDPLAYLDTLPLGRIRYVHVAGHAREEDVLVDTHQGPVPAAVWRLYDELVARTGPVDTLVEWDAFVPALDVVLDEADKARARCLEGAR